MKVVIAPDSFKGSLSAKEVAASIEKGIKSACKDIETVKVPMADGGEGTVQSLIDATGGRTVKIKVKDPLMRDIEASYGILGDGNTAIIEMSAASGLVLAGNKQNPMKTSTVGTGQMIENAIDIGCRNIIIGLGGSATNDGGIGMMAVLGVRFLDKEDNQIELNGEGLKYLKKIDTSMMDKRIEKCKFKAACDVDNPLCGVHGASYVFAPQKGADESMVKTLDGNMENYADLIKKYLYSDIKNARGAGAAGGMGAAILAFLKGELESGVRIVIDMVKLEDKIKNCDLVITGEGMIDYQTAHGKTPYGVAMLAKKYNIPVIAISGGIGKNAEELYDKEFDSMFSITDKPMSLCEAIENCDELLQKTAERIIRTMLCTRKFK